MIVNQQTADRISSMNILGIDYGTKRIGIAIAVGPLAEPLGVITNSIDKGKGEVVSPAVLEQLKSLVTEREIEKIVVGISENAMAEQSRRLISSLQNIFELPIVEADETLSSVTATEHMQHMKKKKKRGAIDHFAATILLQDYLDQQHDDL